MVISGAAAWCWVQFSTGVSSGWFPRASEPPPYVTCVRSAAKPGWVPAAAAHHGHLLLGSGGGIGSGAGIAVALIAVAAALGGKLMKGRG
jgi:hypothetical protein